MGKLRYFYGCMSSMKSATLLMKSHQFEESGAKVILLKPSFDTRGKLGNIESRAVISSKNCIVFGQEDNLYEQFKYEIGTIFFIDEVQFANKEHIQQLLRLSFNNEVFCYGLKNSYNNRIFPASLELLALASTIEEIKSKCARCSSKSTTHLRIVGNETIFGDVDAIIGDIKGEERYESVCQECWQKEFDKNINIY